MHHFIPPLGSYMLEDTTGQTTMFPLPNADISAAHQFMRLVLRTRQQPMEQDARRRWIRTELGKHEFLVCRYSNMDVPHLRLEPQLRLFLQVYASHRALMRDGSPIESGWELTCSFTEFISQLRHAAHVGGVKKQQADWESTFRKNASRMRSLERACFRASTFVTVVPAHFVLNEWILSPGEVTSHIPPTATASTPRNHRSAGVYDQGHRVGFDDFRLARLRFFAKLKGRTSLNAKLLTYAWRMNFAPVAGYHMHAVFYFAAVPTADSFALWQGLEQLWTSVTQGRGSFSRTAACTADDMFRRGFGLIHETDAAKRQNYRRLTGLRLPPHPHATIVVHGRPATMFKTGELPKRAAAQLGANRGISGKSSISNFVIPEKNQALTENANARWTVVAPLERRASEGGANRE